MKASMERVKGKSEEIAFATAKGLISSIPVIGPVAAEIAGTVIPQRRMDRIEKLFTYLAGSVSGLDPEYVQEKMQEPEFVDLLEEAIADAAKAKSEERLKTIAHGLKAGIVGDIEIEFLNRFRSIVNRIDDMDLSVAMSVCLWNRENMASPVAKEEELVAFILDDIYRYSDIDAPEEERFAYQISISLQRISQEGILTRREKDELTGAYIAEPTEPDTEVVYGFTRFGREFFDFLWSVLTSDDEDSPSGVTTDDAGKAA